jgi:hypothetical protein
MGIGMGRAGTADGNSGKQELSHVADRGERDRNPAGSLDRFRAGWMIFALLGPAAVCGAKVGSAVAADASSGGCIVAACVSGSVACAEILAKAT